MHDDDGDVITLTSCPWAESWEQESMLTEWHSVVSEGHRPMAYYDTPAWIIGGEALINHILRVERMRIQDKARVANGW